MRRDRSELKPLPQAVESSSYNGQISGDAHSSAFYIKNLPRERDTLDEIIPYFAYAIQGL